MGVNFGVVDILLTPLGNMLMKKQSKNIGSSQKVGGFRI